MDNEYDMYNSVYKELAEMLGIDAALKIFGQFKGQQVSFPIRLYNSDFVRTSVIREYNGSNIRTLAKKYDYSEKTIRRMLKTENDEL